MALSGSFTTNSITDYGLTTYFRFSWTATQSVANNTSTVSWNVTTIQSPQGSGYQRTIMGGSTVTVNGRSYTISSGQGAYNGLQIASGSTVINHNDDGSKTFAVSLKVSLGYANSNSNVGSSNFTLDVIARASAITLDKSAMEIDGSNSVTITVTKKNSAFTDNLSYDFNGTTGSLGENVGTNTVWLPGIALLSAIPNTTSALCTITCTTYNGSTVVGTSTATITLSTSAVPTISATVENTTVRLNGAPYGGNWLRYRSTGTVRGSASSPGASITSYSIMNGSTELGTTLPLNISNLTVNTIVIYATDSRGQTGSKTITLTPWIDYVKPTIAIDSMTRASSTDATTTVTVALSGTATLYSVLNTTYTISVATGSITNSDTLSTSRTDVHWQQNLTLSNIAREQAYTVTATINDTFVETSVTARLRRAVPVIHMGNSPSPHFDVEGNLIIHGDSAKIIWRDDNGQDWEMTLTKFKSLI